MPESSETVPNRPPDLDPAGGSRPPAGRGAAALRRRRRQAPGVTVDLRAPVLPFGPDVTWTSDLDLNLTYASPAVQDLLGYAPAELVPGSLERVLRPAACKTVRSILRRMAAERPTAAGRISRESMLALELVRKDGKGVWTETTVSIMRGADRSPSGIIGLTRDASDQGSGEEAALRGTETLLLVEDDGLVREVLQLDLGDWGYKVVAAADRHSAREAARALGGPPDLLITEVFLPGGTGREVYEDLASLRPGLGVIYLSGHAEGSLTDRLLLVRGGFFLREPFDRIQLGRLLRRALDAPAGSRATTPCPRLRPEEDAAPSGGKGPKG
jgi:PAS domain S-box-containing protein